MSLSRIATLAIRIPSSKLRRGFNCTSVGETAGKAYLPVAFDLLRDALSAIFGLSELKVYHRRRPTLRLLILPSVSPFPPTIRRTARISVLPIEPNLAERARIFTINLDDYQLDPVIPPPSPSSPFSMAAYQRMIAEMDPTQREEALTAYGTETGQGSVPVPETALTVCMMRLRGQLYTILEDMNHYPNACLEELEALMTLWDVEPRDKVNSWETPSLDELITQLRQVCEDAEDRASNS
ncbi:hypothetical protein Tco_0226838 [Tanacetum coccineum]